MYTVGSIKTPLSPLFNNFIDDNLGSQKSTVKEQDKLLQLICKGDGGSAQGIPCTGRQSMGHTIRHTHIHPYKLIKS